MSRTRAPQRSAPSAPQNRRRLAVGSAALALVSGAVLTACGNASVQQKNDTRPEPNASTEGVRSVYPTTPVTPDPIADLRSGPPTPTPTPAP